MAERKYFGELTLQQMKDNTDKLVNMKQAPGATYNYEIGGSAKYPKGQPWSDQYDDWYYGDYLPSLELSQIWGEHISTYTNNIEHFNGILSKIETLKTQLESFLGNIESSRDKMKEGYADSGFANGYFASEIYNNICSQYDPLITNLDSLSQKIETKIQEYEDLNKEAKRYKSSLDISIQEEQAEARTN